MKRVLNSGSIKLPYIQGSEKDFQENISLYLENDHFEWLKESGLLDRIKFTFEIKAPLLVFVEGFQKAHLGTLKLQDGLDHQIGYLPPSFYTVGPSGTSVMSPKSCNDLNTKLNNFYNWSFNFYNKLIENGLDKNQAAFVLPQGVFKTFIWQVNSKDLISFIEQNIVKSPELNGYCSTLVLYLEDHLPNVTAWLKRNQWKDLI